MLKSFGKAAIALLLCLAGGNQLSAQFYPLPASKSEPASICTTCVGNNSSGQANAGLPTYPYDKPLVDFVGRYVDSSTTLSFQHVGIRTVRARLIRVAPNQRGTAPPRLYVGLGEAVGAYSIDNFFNTKLPAGPKKVNEIGTGGYWPGRNPDPLELATPPDGFLYPEATNAKWSVPLVDGQTRLYDFDFDDRGYLYAAYSSFGWGIVKDEGGTTGGHFAKVVQMLGTGSTVFPKTLPDPNGVSSPWYIVVVKSGAKYYAAVSDGTKSQHNLYDVTDPAAPKFVATRTVGIRQWSRDDANERLAVVTATGLLQVYDYAGFVAGREPIAQFTGRNGNFVDVSFDEQGDVWAIDTRNLWQLRAVGNSYNDTVHTPYGTTFEPRVLHAAAGHIAMVGVDKTIGAYDVRLLKAETAGPAPIDVDGYFRKFYHKAPSGYAEACNYCGFGYFNHTDVHIVKNGGKTYLMYSTGGLGDVFEIQGSDSISLSKKDTFGAVNPHATTTDGPYIGDIVTFRAASSSPSKSYDVTWNFGNPESSDNTAGPKKTGLDVTHQYTGLSTAAMITAPKTVRAITVEDSQINSQMLLTLKVPTPRIGISGVATPLVVNTTGAEIVAGSTFRDASDGSVESHYGTWTIDNTATKFKPGATDIAVGAVGPHTLSFVGSYGKYDPVALTGTAQYNTTPLTLAYIVKPFVAKINAPTRSGTNIRFSGNPLRTTDLTILPAVTWNVTWTLTNSLAGAGSVSTAATKTQTNPGVAVGTIPNFDVAEAEVTAGSTVTLEIAVDLAGLSLPAQAYAVDTDTITLTPPNPMIQQTECENANGPCKLEAKSETSAATTDWVYAWTLRKDSTTGSVVGVSTAATFEPTITTAGNYVAILKTTKGIFEVTKTKTFTVAAALCGPPPSSTQAAINVSCLTCTPGMEITFSASFFGYSKQACDEITWTFGDGGSATGSPVQHTYASAGTYRVTMKVINTSGTATETKDIEVKTVTQPPPSCTAPTNVTFTWDGSAGCQPGTSCRTTEQITFTPRRGVLALANCDSVSWNFGDNTTSTSKTPPAKQYSTAGTYTVSLTVTNSFGTQTMTRDVTVIPPPTGNCTVPPALGNFAIMVSGGTSGCSNGTQCQHGEVITMTTQAIQYTPGPCDNFEWDFADGTPKVTTRNATHTFAGGQTEYQVKFKVSNTAGFYIYTRTVKFGASTPVQPLPVLTPTTFPSTAQKGKTVTFVATSNMDSTGWTWNFGTGEGAPNTTQAGLTQRTSTITHTFTTTGAKTVRVTARNPAGAVTELGAAQGTITITEPPAIPEYRFLLPATAYFDTPAVWRTDVQIYNPDPSVSEAKPLIMEAEFKGKTYTMEMIKATHIYEDFLGGLLSHQRYDQGPVIITTKNAMNPPQIWTRTYIQTSAGTFGQFVPAIRLDNVGGNGGATAEGAYFLSGLRHDTRYRTNVGFLNPNAAAMTVTVKAYDEEGFAITGAEFPLTLQPFQLEQFQLKSKMPTLPMDAPFSLKVNVPPSQWLVGYASYIDGMSNDPVYLQLVRDTDFTSGDFKKSVIPGVGHVQSWRSDVTILNPDSTGMQFDLRYYDAAGVKRAEALSVRLGAGEFLQYGDILKQGVLGNVGDGIGTLEIEVKEDHSVYPMTFARTYFDDLANGTYGQGIGGFAPGRANVKPNKPAFIAGVRNTADYYTNVGLLNVGTTAVSVKVTLLDPNTGAAVNSIDYPLAPFQTVVGAYGGFGSITSGTFKIEANGNVWAFASIIDKRTKDPEYVPAQ